ncbi:MAG: DsbA family protein [Candidatus Altiarchaeota archaeon]
MNMKIAAFAVIVALLLWGIFQQTSAFMGWDVSSREYRPAPTKEQTDDQIEGEADKAAVEVVEFSDFQCPYCATASETVHQLKENYGPEIKVIYRHFPLSFHKYAQKAAEASECARIQGRFWSYHDTLFLNQGRIDQASLKQYARDLNLDAARFDECLDSGETRGLVESQLNEGLELGVQSTPTFFVAGQMVVGAQPYKNFAQIIDLFIESKEEKQNGKK